MPTRSIQFRFTPEQRNRLIKLDVTARQITSLEEHCVIGRAMLRKPPRVMDVRDCLKDIQKPLRTAKERWSRLVGHGHSKPLATRAAEQRLYAATISTKISHDIIERAPNDLERLLTLLETAIKELPKTARWHSANPYPVAQIDRALNIACEGNAHNIHHPSSASFREIVGICYEAMSEGEITYPETAIKRYVQGINEEREKRWREFGFEQPPRKLQLRNPGKEVPK